MEQDAVLVCDLGGTSLRVALIGADGAILALDRTPLASGLEADPEDWWRGFLAGVEAVAAAAPEAFSRRRAIAISAFTRSQVFLNADGRPARPAILWADARAAEAAAALAAGGCADHPEWRELNAFHPLARLCWLRQAEPAAAAAVKTVLEPKDYLNFRLTGRVAGDLVSMARLRAAAMAGPDGRSLFDVAGLDPALIPPLLAPTAVMGRTAQGLPGVLGAASDLPVMAMANDSWAGVVGLGAMRAGVAYNISGTTEVFGLVSAAPATAEGLLTVHWGDGLIQLGGPSQTGADALAWLREILATGPEFETSAFLEAPRAPEPLLFLPYLQGERVPYWDPTLRGAFIGLNRHHKAVDLAWAVMEGVAYQNRVVLERAERAIDAQVSEIRYGGGGAASAVWRQIKADVLNRPVCAPTTPEPGLAGAAIVAWLGLGRFPDLAAAQDALTASGARYVPSPDRRARYDRLYGLFREAESAVAPISRALAVDGKGAALR